MGCGCCSARTASFTLLTFLQCLSQNKAQIPLGTASARGCFLMGTSGRSSSRTCLHLLL